MSGEKLPIGDTQDTRQLMNSRPYDPEKDAEAGHRIWREVGWIDDEDGEKGMDLFLSGSRTLVADIHGAAECLVSSMPGSIRYLDQDLSFSAITAVTTSRIARKRGLAQRLTAQLIAGDAVGGAQVAGLGMFEQGFYDLLGFGAGSYEHWISFDPAQLRVKVRPRVPRRLGKEDWQAMHAALMNRQRGHGAANLFPAIGMKAEFIWTKDAFGLGYHDGPDDALTHFFWAQGSGEHGPYTITFIAYQTWEQFLELLAVIKNLGDQVRQVWMREPSGIALQDLLRQPFRFRQLTEKSKFQQTNRATAYWQLRILDLPGCLARTSLPGPALRFNLDLSDPIAAFLPADALWRGIGGQYTIALGPDSSAEPGPDPDLPTLSASVGAFTRLWMGVRPATGLAVTDDLSAPPDLLAALDRTLRLPPPRLDWDF